MSFFIKVLLKKPLLESGGLIQEKVESTPPNQDIGIWDTSSVTIMASMFQYGSVFDQDIGNWDTSNVTLIHLMFEQATVFNQDLSRWCVINITNSASFSTSSALTDANKPVWGTCP